MHNITTITKMALKGQDYRDWYRWAKSDIAKACKQLGCCPQRFSDIMALTSPRASVTRNVRWTIMLMGSPNVKPHDMMHNIWASVQHYYRTGEIRGPKTGPFARALKGDLSAIPLDVWMARALGVEHTKLATKQVREPAQALIKRVADRLGWPPAEVQAAVWATAARAGGRRPPTVSVFDSLTLWSVA